MIRWEYASMLNEGPSPKEQLDDLGNEGWELVSVLQGQGSGKLLYVFKRPKPESNAEIVGGGTV